MLDHSTHCVKYSCSRYVRDMHEKQKHVLQSHVLLPSGTTSSQHPADRQSSDGGVVEKKVPPIRISTKPRGLPGEKPGIAVVLPPKQVSTDSFQSLSNQAPYLTNT